MSAAAALSLDDWKSRAAGLSHRSQAFIDGDYVDAQSGETFDCVNPANAQVLTAIASCDAADVDRAVAAARRAFDDGRWSDLPPVVRKKKLLRFAGHVVEFLGRDSIRTSQPRDVGFGHPVALAGMDGESVVLTNEEHRQFLQGGEVQAFVKRSLLDRAVSEERRDDSLLAFHL